MPMILNNVEARVLASLVEKGVTTPEYYPLTLNALVQACNQKNNRDPVVSFDEAMVAHALETLREKNLVYVFYGSGSRVPKYKQMAKEVYEITEPELAVLTILMLRGAQTVGELRERASRLHEFSGLGEVEETLTSLLSKEPDALVARLPRQPGHKEARYAHLLSGEASVEQPLEAATDARGGARTAGDRVTRLEQQVESLVEEVRDLRQQLDEFKGQFG